MFFSEGFFKKRLFVALFLVVVYILQLHKKLLSIRVLWTRSFVSKQMYWFLYTLIIVAYELFARDFLFFNVLLCV